jgi:hypothetical protein
MEVSKFEQLNIYNNKKYHNSNKKNEAALVKAASIK